MYSITLLVERDEEELELHISGSVSSYVPAVTHLRPENCHPSEGGEVEIEKITLKGNEWNGELTDNERTRAEESLTEAARDDEDPPDSDDYFDDDLEVIDYPEHF